MKPQSPKSEKNAPDHSPVALLLIDVINDLDFPEAKQLLRYALPAARRIRELRRRAVKAGVPVIYVNDNFGRWRSDFREQVRHCIHDGVPGSALATLLLPGEKDYFVLKPKHSGFFSTALELLLKHLGARTLILAGFAADICVLYTANDAFMRDFKLIIARDCVASETKRATTNALNQMKRHLDAEVKDSRHIRFQKKR
jgi:nicotinamidase-related amidase